MAKKADIGAGIALDGEKEFKQAISGINKDLSVLASEMKLASAQFDANNDSVESLTKQAEIYNKQIDTQKKKIEEIQKALKNSAELYGENDKKTKDWQISLNKAQAELVQQEKQLKACTDRIENYDKQTDEAEKETKQFGKAMDNSGKSASFFGDMLKANLLSDVIIGGLKAMANVAMDCARKLIDFGKQGIELASDLTEVQNVVDTTFGSNSKTIEDFSKKATAAYGMSELTAKKYNGTMGAMLKSTGLTEKQVLTMSQAMTGLSGDMASFYNLSSDEAFEKIRSGISGETEPLKQLGINMSVANLEAFALSQGITKAYKSMSQAEQTTLRYNYLMKATADAQGDFAKTSDSFANQQRIAKLNIENLSATIGKALLPSINGLLKSFNSLISGEGDITGVFDVINNSITGLVSKFGEIGGEIVKVIPKAVEGFNLIVTSLMQQIPVIMPKFVSGIYTLFLGIIDGLKNAVSKLTENMPQTIDGIVTAITENLPKVIEGSIQLFIGIATGLAQALPLIIAKIPEIVTAIVDGFIASADDISRLNDAIGQKKDEIKQSIIDGISGLNDAIGQKRAELWESIKTFFEELPENFGKLIEKLLASIVKFGKDAKEWIVTELPVLVANVLGFIEEIPDKLKAFFSTEVPILISEIISFFDELPTKIAVVGVNMIKGLWQGVQDTIGWLKEKMSDFANGIIEGFKEEMDIHSPSRKFAWLGEMSAKGLGVGFESEMQSVNKKMRSAVNTSFETAKIDVESSYKTNSSANSKAIGSIVFNQYNQSPKALSNAEIYRQTNQGLQLARIGGL